MLLIKSKFLLFTNQKYSYSIIKAVAAKNVKHVIKTCTQEDTDIGKLLKDYGYGYGNKMIYNTKIEKVKEKLGYKNHYFHERNKKIYKQQLEHILDKTQPLPISLKYYVGDDIQIENEKVIPNLHDHVVDHIENKDVEQHNYTNFPLNISYHLGQNISVNVKEENISLSRASRVDEDIRKKYKLLKHTKNWMMSYDNYENDLLELEDESLLEDWDINYGTADPESKISSVPCGGCGALLHCKVSNMVI